MADNFVRLVVGATDADATAHLEALKARLDEIGRKVETASVNIKGDKEAEIALARLAIRLDSLGRKIEQPKITLEGVGRAIIGAETVSLALDKLGRKVDGGTGRGGLIGAFRSLDYAALTAMGSLGSAGTALINPITVALAGLAAIMAGPLIASLLPITAGFAAFAAAAVPEVEKVWKAVNQGGAALKKLDPQERALAGPIRSLGAEFDKLQKAIKPEVLKAFAEGLKIIKELMPAIKPLAKAAGKAIDDFLGKMVDWLRSPSGKKFLHWLEVDGPNAIAKFSSAMWIAAQIVGRAFSFLKNAGESWWKNFNTLVHFFETLWRNAVQGFTQLGHLLEHEFDNLRNAWDTAWSAITAALQAAWGVISGIFHEIEAAISGLAGAISGIMGAIGGLASAAGGIGGFLGRINPFASGGVVGAAASGGLFSGLTLVGERGPELVKLPTGSTVYNAGQTQNLAGAGQGGGGQVIVQLEVAPGGASAFEQFMVQAIRQWVRTKGGGSVQTAFGRA